MPFVTFDNIAREWRCKFSTDSDNASLMAAQAKLEEVLPEVSSVEGAASVQRIVCGGCQALKAIPGISAVETQTYTLEEVKMSKKDCKKHQEKKEKEQAEKSKDEKPAEDPAKKLKKVIKEGGKRGVEIEGAADMGGLQFFCTSVDEPEGDVELLEKCVGAM